MRAANRFPFPVLRTLTLDAESFAALAPDTIVVLAR